MNQKRPSFKKFVAENANLSSPAMPKQNQGAQSARKKGDSELESLLHSEHVVIIEKMAVGGDAVARIPYKDKSLVVFVERAAPDEEVKIQITSVEKSFLKGRIISIIRPSVHRRAAPCPYFNECGGCSWQHFDEDEQLHQKENLLRELFQKFLPAFVFSLEASVRSEKLFGYRNRIQLKHLESKLGYFQRNSHSIVDIDACLIADEKISAEISVLKRKLKPTVELKKYELRLNQQNQFESYRIGESGEGLAFSQVNNVVNLRLVAVVKEVAQESKPGFISELYAGSGNFTFEILSHLKNTRVESAELNPELTSYTTKKMLELGLQKRLLSFTANCDDFVQRRPLSKDFILLDPPRSGCSDVVINQVASTSAQNVVYISCHPVYLLRDLKRLLSSQPKYEIKKVQIFDMFPQTDHFETFVHLSLNES